MPDVVLFVIRKKAGIEDYDRLVHTLWSVRRYGLYNSLVHYYKLLITCPACVRLSIINPDIIDY